MKNDYHLLFGPIGSTKNLITHIVLPNCEEYLNCVKQATERGNSVAHDRYARFRFFFNAVLSVNQILDYLYFENHVIITPTDFRDKYYSKYPDLKKVNELANAFKHCIRGHYDKKGNKFEKNSNVLHSSDLSKTKVEVNINQDKIDLKINHETLEDNNLIERLFVFLVGQLNEDEILI